MPKTWRVLQVTQNIRSSCADVGTSLPLASKFEEGICVTTIIILLFLSGELFDWKFHYLIMRLQPRSKCLLAFSASVWAKWMRLAPTEG